MAKHKIILMRHAKSDWLTGAQSDFDRPLARRGRKDAPRMGRWLHKQALYPDRFISSPARRTRETALCVADALEFPRGDIVWEQPLYEASLEDLLAVINNHCTGAKRLLVIAHNPGLDTLLEFLARDQAQLSSTGKLMTTAAVAVLDFGAVPISTNPASAHLEHLVRPRELDT
jgi:phosphohistidine phosphatase